MGAYAASFLAGGAICRLSGAAQGAFDAGSAIATNDADLADLPLRICIDANSLRLAERSGALDKVQAVSDWQNSTLFSEEERAALAYAEAVTATPPQVDENIKSLLKRHFTEETITEMTALIAFQNLSARFNAALDIPAQGLCATFKGKPHAG